MQAAEPSPPIYIRTRWLPPLLHVVAALLLLALVVWLGQAREMPPWLALMLGMASVAYFAAAGALLLDRAPKVILRHDSVEVILCRTGPIRYHDIVHVECFRVRDQAAVALFVTAEMQARLPHSAADRRTPVFANEMFDGTPIWFVDGPLEYTAHEIVAELNARRRGSTGPIAARQSRRPLLK